MPCITLALRPVPGVLPPPFPQAECEEKVMATEKLLRVVRAKQIEGGRYKSWREPAPYHPVAAQCDPHREPTASGMIYGGGGSPVFCHLPSGWREPYARPSAPPPASSEESRQSRRAWLVPPLPRALAAPGHRSCGRSCAQFPTPWETEDGGEARVGEECPSPLAIGVSTRILG